MSKSQDTKSLAKVTRRAIITGAAATVATYAASRSDAKPPSTPASEIPDFWSYQAFGAVSEQRTPISSTMPGIRPSGCHYEK